MPLVTAERRFYLEHFRGRTVVICGPDPDHAARGAIDLLVAAGVRIVRVQVARPRGGRPAGGAAAGPSPLDDRAVVSIWQRTRDQGMAVVHLGADDAGSVVAAADVAIRLRAHKLVILDPSASSAVDGQPAPFRRMEDLLGADADGSEGGVADAHLAQLISRTLSAGVEGVNVCRPQDLEAELLTYTGAGTLYTAAAYATVRRMGIDDYDQAQRLIDMGIDDGYLKPRPPAEVDQLVVNGFGAFVGDTHLAGFAALLTEPYAQDRMAEVCALSTISRFSGEGVGRQIVEALVRAAEAEQQAAVFACTVSPVAARFFAALGFEEVAHEHIPAAKWASYDADRRQQVRAMCRRLSSSSGSPPHAAG